jgi:hypothetical protein
LQLLARRRSHDVDAGIGQVGFVGRAHLAGAASEQRLKSLAEILVDAREGFGDR